MPAIFYRNNLTMSHTVSNIIYGTYLNLDNLKDEPLALLAAYFSIYEIPEEFSVLLENPITSSTNQETVGPSDKEVEVDGASGSDDEDETKVKPEFDLDSPDLPRPRLTLESDLRQELITKVQKKTLAQKIKTMPKPIRINLRKVQHYSIWSCPN